MTPLVTDWEPDADEIRDALAELLMDACVNINALPAHVPGTPSGLAATRTAVRLAPVFVRGLEALYGVRQWDEREFERAFLQGAAREWQPDSEVRRTPDGFRRVNRACPVKAEVELDPRVCQECRAFHEAVAREALAGRVASVRFPRVLARGDTDCTMEISLDPKEGE